MKVEELEKYGAAPEMPKEISIAFLKFIEKGYAPNNAHLNK